jgi:hypothetical protein
MSRSLYHLIFDLADPDKTLIVAEETPESPCYDSQPSTVVLATYSVDNDYDFGSITVEDAIIEMHENELSMDNGIVKLMDGYYTKNGVFK